MSLSPAELWRTSARRSRMEFDREYIQRHHPVWYEQMVLAEKKRSEELKREQATLVFPAVALLATAQNA